MKLSSILAATAIFAVMSLACAFAWDFDSLLVCRFIQGIGVGGEMPVAAVYISELSKARGRGKFFLLYEMIFPIGLMATGQAGALLVPWLGWKVMFLLGGIPGIIIAIGLLRLPESPRWLIGRGRLDDAEAVVASMERAARGPLPAPVYWSICRSPSELPKAMTGRRPMWSDSLPTTSNELSTAIA